MIHVLMALAMMGQVQSADTVDVSTLVSTILSESVDGERSILARLAPHPLYIDIDRSGSVLRAALTHDVVVAGRTNAADLLQHATVTANPLRCATSEITSQCRIEGTARYITLRQVERLDSTTIRLTIAVLWTVRSPNGTTRLTGFSSVREVEQLASDRWRTRKVLGTIVG